MNVLGLQSLLPCLRTPRLLVACLLCSPQGLGQAASHHVLNFERIQLSDIYYAEGAGFGDVNGDGQLDLVYGPHWYAGPKFKKRVELYPAKPQPMSFYADNFFTWLHDFDGDGDADVLVVGLPGTPAFLFENPGHEHLDKHWMKHQVFDAVANESPQFLDLDGDAQPELVCTSGGRFGYLEYDAGAPFAPWNFRVLSDQATHVRFGHGLGVGDIDGDGRQDVLYPGGWFQQPSDAGTGQWVHHAAAFTSSYGGADMFAYDVDGDGDQDVLATVAAHDFGVAWYEQTQVDGQLVFLEHLIIGSQPHQSPYGLVFSEPHALGLVDMDGDGLKDLVTGKTYYSHHEKSPMWDAGAVVYWFRLTRTEQGVNWIPFLANGETGIGRQLSIVDANGDGLPDILVGGMLGGNVLIQKRSAVSKSVWEAACPKPYALDQQRKDRGAAEELDQTTGRVPGAIEGESMTVVSISAGQVSTQAMGAFPGDRWSGDQQLFWRGASPGARLELEFTMKGQGSYEVEASFTVAGDYGIVQVLLNGSPLGEPIDLFHSPGVTTSGTLKLGRRALEAGPQRLTLESVGINPAAKKAYMVGFDYLRLVHL